MKIYVHCKRNGEDVYPAYQGLDADTVTRLLTELGATDIQFLSEAQYVAAVGD